MKKVLLAGISAVAVAAIAPANAADLGRPVYRAQPAYVPVPVPVYSWTGCCIGGHVGWGWGSETVSIPNLGETTGLPVLEGVSLGPVTGDTSGFLGGGQVGCNYQFVPNWLIGIEGEGSAADIKGDVHESFSFVDPNGFPHTVTGTAHAQTDWIASATNTQQTYRPLTNTSKPLLRDRAGRLVVVSNGPFGTIGRQKSSTISMTSA